MYETLTYYPITLLFFIAFCSFITSVIHGATGLGGGFLLAIILSFFIGIKPLLPVISFVLLFSHAFRALLNFKSLNYKAFLAVILPALPCIILFAFFYGKLASTSIALIFGLTIIASIPIRHWANHIKLKTSTPVLSSAGGLYGALSGITLGPGLFLTPFLLGYGLNRKAFVASLALIALLANLTRLSVYSNLDLLHPHIIFPSLIAGFMTLPGNWVGRYFLRKMNNKKHSLFIDLLTLIGALYFIWIAFKY